MSHFSLDVLDRALLRLLQEDANRTLHDLGQLIGLSGPAVQRRVQRHKASGLIRRTVVQLDPAMAGVPLTVLNLATLERDSGLAVTALRRRITDHPNVQQCYELAGNFDLATILSVPDMESYRMVVDELFGSDDNVQRFASHIMLDTIKATLMVPV